MCSCSSRYDPQRRAMDTYQTGPPNWVFLLALFAFMVWLFFTFFVIDWILRPLTAVITGVQLQRVRSPNGGFTWAPVGEGGVWVAFGYELLMWFIAVVVPILFVLLAMYVQWMYEHG